MGRGSLQAYRAVRFSRTVPNPFTFDRPLPADQLVDRAAELEQLLSLATSGQSVRLTAPRRYGKTTLLNALADTAWQAHEMIPTVVDLSGVTTLDDVVLRLTRAYERGLDRGKLRGVWRGLRRRGTGNAQLGVPGVASVTAGVGVPAAASSLAALHDALDLPTRVFARTGQRCLVVLDEFQDLFTVGEGLDGILRSHLQHQAESASYVFAGSQPSMMRALFGDRSRPLFEQARAILLGPLPAADLADFVEDRLARAGRDGLLELVDGLVAVSAGHPQRSMLLAHMLYEQADDDPDALPRAVAAALREATDGLEQTWRALSDGRRRVLGALAAGHVELTGKAALAHTGHGKGTQAGLRDALAADTLIARDASGPWRFVDPFLALWLTQPR